MQQASAHTDADRTLTLPNGPVRKTRRAEAWAQLQIVMRPVQTVMSRFAEYGDVYRVQQGTSALYVVRHPDHIREILTTRAASFDKGHAAFQRLSLVLGDALLTSDGDRWRRQRRLVQPAFARPRLAEYSNAMVDETARAVERLSEVARAAERRGRQGRCELSREMNSLTLAIVTRTLFGHVSHESERNAQAMLELNRWFGTPPMLLRVMPRMAARFKRAVSTLDDAIEQVIAARRLATDGRADLLSALMLARDADGEMLTARELRDQLLTLYVAGHETTSHALTWTLYLLDKHPDVLARLDAEHAAVLAGRLPTFDDLAALPYTELVIKEALRIYPPAFVVPRRASEDTSIGPYAVPKGSEVVIWLYCTHHDPRWYPDPQAFQPERFSAAREAERPKYAYLPFGAGQRACIGQMFATIEAQLILATLLPRLRFEYTARRAPGLRLGVTLAPRNGMPMRVRVRERT
jgi:cytochrome P450